MKFLAFFFVFIALFSSWGCSPEKVSAAAAAPVKPEAPPDPNVYSFGRPEEFPLVSAETRRVHDDLQVNGVVAPDVNRTVPVNALSGGRAVEIHTRLGDEVKKGQLLLRIHSADLAGAYSDYHKALADEVLSRKALDRVKALLEHGAAAQKDVEVAEDAEQKAQVDVRTTAERIRILGGNVDHPSPVLDVTAPVSGTIVEQNIQAAGGVKSLDNSPNLFTIADLSEVWILCDVYENNLSQVRIGDVAEVRSERLSRSPFAGPCAQHLELARSRDAHGQGASGTAESRRADASRHVRRGPLLVAGGARSRSAAGHLHPAPARQGLDLPAARRHRVPAR